MTDQTIATSRLEAEQLDAEDPLAEWRHQFHIPLNWIQEPVVYLVGNSLGLQPRNTIDYIEHELRQWREVGVDGHFRGTHPWMPYHELVAETSASLVGASPGEVVMMNALTVNLHLMLVSFYRPSDERTKIVIESRAFPSDQYAVRSQAAFHGLDPSQHVVELKPRPGEHTLRTNDILEFLDREGDSIATVLLGGVNYYTGQLFDIPSITEVAHRRGCKVGFDLAHAVGNVPLQLHDWDVDFAVWCTYKYLNAGPGSVGGCFIHERHISDEAVPRFAGWWGHDKSTRFSMSDAFVPIGTAEGWLISNSPILYLASLRSSLEIFESVGMEALRQKSLQLTGYLEAALQNSGDSSFEIITPANTAERGAQLSLLFSNDARERLKRLSEADIVCDYRDPNVIRVAPVPLYNTYLDVQKFVDVLTG